MLDSIGMGFAGFVLEGKGLSEEMVKTASRCESAMMSLGEKSSLWYGL